MSKIEPLANIDADTLARFDAIIDVRSPAEFAEDHIPGAVNLPVLSNEERHIVGTQYKQVSTFTARRMGAAHISRNVAGHLEEYFADKAPASQFLIYCWRGGMRSGSMATIISQVGWRTHVLSGGYKNWRRKVVNELRNSQAPLNIILLDGQTGSAKTEVLTRAEKLGIQILDLEGLAAHRGSVFGAMQDTAQPSQKRFESLLWDRLSHLDVNKPILVEAESNHIGAREIPSRIWASMLTAQHIVIEAPAKSRATFLVETYKDIISDRAALQTSINRLSQYHSSQTIEAWHEMVMAEGFVSLAHELMVEHYDPLYGRSGARRSHPPLNSIELQGMAETDLDAAAQKVKTIISNHAAIGQLPRKPEQDSKHS